MKKFFLSLKFLFVSATCVSCQSAPVLIEHHYPPASSFDERKTEVAAAVREIQPSVVTRAHSLGFSEPLLSLKEKNELAQRGVEQLSQGDSSGALKLFQEAERSRGLDDKEQLVMAQAYFEQNEFDRAYELAKNLWDKLEMRRARPLHEELKMSPYREASLLLTSLQIQMGETETAVPFLADMIAYTRDWAPPYAVLAHYYFDKASYGLAQRVAELGLDRTGPQENLLMLLVRAQRAQGLMDDSNMTLQRVVRIFPQSLEGQLFLGISEFESGRLVSGCERFELLFRRSPQEGPVSHNHAMCLVRKGELVKAESVVARALSLNPEFSQLTLLGGHIARRLGQIDKARQSYQDFLLRSSQEDPRRPFVEAEIAGLELILEREGGRYLSRQTTPMGMDGEEKKRTEEKK